jgi:hypothetical protein
MKKIGYGMLHSMVLVQKSKLAGLTLLFNVCTYFAVHVLYIDRRWVTLFGFPLFRTHTCSEADNVRVCMYNISKTGGGWVMS